MAWSDMFFGSGQECQRDALQWFYNYREDDEVTTATIRPAFRKPWTHGAKAYFEADTFDALREGMKRMRKSKLVHMPNDGEAGLVPCAACGVLLKDAYAVNPGEEPRKVDEWSTWTWLPKQKAAYGQHYYCSWGTLMNRLFDLADRGLLR